MLLAIVFVLLVDALWLLFAAPLGTRTVTRRRTINAAPEHILSALDPAGDNIGWNGSVAKAQQLDDGTRVHIVSGHAGRDGKPIERIANRERHGVADGLTVTYSDDTALSDAFWAHYRLDVACEAIDAHQTLVTMRETDHYSGLGPLIFRFFALNRSIRKLKIWAETGQFAPGGMFEHPFTQCAMGVLSVFLIWPLFGLTWGGFLLSLALTITVGLHELGHVAAFRIMGHKRARMIFIPLLGGIAIGGRPYDRQFEVAFAALMGAGFSAFFVAAMWLIAPSVIGTQLWLIVFVIIAAFFNLANMLPINRFDGGQVLRQIWRSEAGRGLAAAGVITGFIAVLLAAGLPFSHAVGGGAVVLLLSLLTGSKTIKPRRPLTAMTRIERQAMIAGLASVIAIHGFAMVWAVQLYLS